MSLNITQKDLERIANQPGYEVTDQMNGPDLSAAVSNGTTGRQEIEWANGPDLSATGHVTWTPEKQDEKDGVRRFTIPYPPSANRYWRMAKNRIVKSTAAKEYIKSVRDAMATDPASGDVVVTLNVYRPRRSGDLDNRIKVALDALQGHAYDDDKQVVEIHAYRHDDKHNPRIDVEIQNRRK